MNLRPLVARTLSELCLRLAAHPSQHTILHFPARPLLRSGLRRPWVIAHRGACQEALENTLPAFRRALQLRADALELDVRLTHDHQLVVFHDASLERLGSSNRPLASLTVPELKRVSLLDGSRIPTLEEVLTDPSCPPCVNIELKLDTRRTDHSELALARLLRRLDCFDRVVVSSFNPFALTRLSVLEPRILRGLLFTPETAWTVLRRPYLAPLARPHFLHPDLDSATPRLIKLAKSLDFPILVWTVDEEKDWQRLVELGVDGIITNRPGALRQFLDDRS